MDLSCKLEKEYSNKDVIDNYNSYKDQIAELKTFFNSVVPRNKFVEIEFEGDTRLFRLGIYNVDTITKEIIYPGFLEWDLKTNSKKVKTAIASIGWTQNILETLKLKLGKVNCISIESGEPCKIGFQRRDMGKYYYVLFEKSMCDSIGSFYKKHCAYNYYNKYVVFEWGNGAVGSGCYPSP